MQSINNNKYYKFLLILLGFFLVLYYIWFRFLRERLPRHIPFELNLINFISLCLICLIYMYIIKQIYKKQTSSNIILNTIYLKISMIFHPLIKYHLHLFLKINVDYFIIKNAGFLIKKYKLYNDKFNLRVIIIFDIIPKIIILLSFIADIFYFKNLNIFYYFILIGLIPLFHSYILYLSKICLEKITNDLQEKFYIKLLSVEENTDSLDFFLPIYSLKYNYNKLLDIKYFIDIQSKNLIYDDDLYEYSIVDILEARKICGETFNMAVLEFDNISKFLSKAFINNVEGAIYLYAFLECDKDINKPFVIKKYLLLIFYIYLFCWFYILIISCSSQNILSVIEFIKLIQPPQTAEGF